MWLAELLKKYAEQGSIQTAATCEAPQDLHGRSIITLTAQEFNCGERGQTPPPATLSPWSWALVWELCPSPLFLPLSHPGILLSPSLLLLKWGSPCGVTQVIRIMQKKLTVVGGLKTALFLAGSCHLGF